MDSIKAEARLGGILYLAMGIPAPSIVSIVPPAPVHISSMISLAPAGIGEPAIIAGMIVKGAKVQPLEAMPT